MIRNYFVVAWRQICRRPLFSLINILGLSTGLSAALVIFLIASHEFGYDRFEKNRDRLYRVVTVARMGSDSFPMISAPPALRNAAEKYIPGIEKTMGFIASGPFSATVINLKSRIRFDEEVNTCFADPDYFTMLGMTWLAGNPQTAMSAPRHVVLTNKQAARYFPRTKPEDCLGRLIVYDDSIPASVSGIVSVPPGLSDFRFTDFLSLTNYSYKYPGYSSDFNSWNNFNRRDQCWITLAEGISSTVTENALNRLLQSNNQSNENGTDGYRLQLQPLTDMHFNDYFTPYTGRAASKTVISGLFAIAGFLLLLACINFINLTTALMSQRAKEIGVRKAMGGSRNTLILQFLLETLLVTTIATGVSCLLVPLWLSVFSGYIPDDLRFTVSAHPSLFAFVPALNLCITILAGAYPAILAAGSRPITVIRNQVTGKTGGRGFVRKGLTVFQFAVAQAFVIATLVMVKQIGFMINTERGFRKQAVVAVYIPGSYSAAPEKNDNRKFVFAQRLKTFPEIERVSIGSWDPSSVGLHTLYTFSDGKKTLQINAGDLSGDPEYLSLYQLRLLAGRNLLPGDSIKEYLINETLLHEFGYTNPNDALGATLNGKPVVGVFKDFIPGLMQKPTEALTLTANNQGAYVVNVALVIHSEGGASPSSIVDRMRKLYNEIYPEREWNFHFVDEMIASYYQSEEKTAELLKWATGLTIFISCLGLMGLVVYTSQARRKEVGVRKVLGASVASIISLLTSGFMRLVLLGFLIAVPVAWWIMHQWLENYAYRTSMDWWVFAISGLGMGLIAIGTLATQTCRSAVENPIKSLRTE